MEGSFRRRVSFLDRARQRGGGDQGNRSNPFSTTMPMLERDILSAVINQWPTTINAELIANAQLVNAQAFWRCLHSAP